MDRRRRLRLGLCAVVLLATALGSWNTDRPATAVAGAGAKTTAQSMQPTASAPSGGRGHLLVIGDSLTLEANEHSGLGYDYLREQMPGAPGRSGEPADRWRSVTVIYKSGQRVAWGVPVVREALKSVPRTSAIVVALGTNDVTGRRADWAGRIRMLLDATGARPVTWLTVEVSPTARALWRRNAREFNAALSQVAAEANYAGQLTVADWAAWFPGSCARPATFTGDGIHLRRDGNKCRARYMVSLSDQMHAALFPS